MTDGAVKVLYDMPEIGGRKVMVFECGVPPTDEFGDADLNALAHRTFNVDNTKKNVYYEAHDMTVQWFKGPFFIGKTPPTKDELEFQLQKWHQARQTRFIVGGIIAAIVLFLLFK